MNKRRIKISVLLGVLAILAIVSFQYLWLKEVFNEEKRKFNQSVHIALLEVTKLLVRHNESQLPQTNPVQRISDDFYLVKINDEIDADILRFYLKNEFEKLNIRSDFEFAIYDCVTDEMVYGDYISFVDHSETVEKSTFFPKVDGLVYYFAVRFPQQLNFLSGTATTWTVITIISLVVLIIYLHSLFVILRQNRYNELQKDFINNMTHEFKTPLSSILIASDYMKNDPTVAGDDRLLRYSEAIFGQSNRLNQHVEKILDLAKSEKNSFALEKSTFNLRNTLHLIADSFRLKYHNALDIRFDCPDHDIFIVGDELHFTNSINNLLDNAHKYSEPPASIYLSARCYSGNVDIEIADKGVGIPKQHLKKIFDKFYRVPKKDSETVNGFGLGLYYVKKICVLHKWKLRVDSLPFEGTRVRLTIPIA